MNRSVNMRTLVSPMPWSLGCCMLLTWVAGTQARDASSPAADWPKAHDARLVVEPFAQSPDIVHPIGIDFDSKGRLLVIESHTHFPPKDYKGPKHDRIRILEDTDGDGKADRFTTFFEGTKATMDIAVHFDGSVYLATRNEILRLRDTDSDGKADKKERLVFLDTKGDYPHNGLSGLCFDSKGDLYFGMGENLGASYKLIGADGKTFADEGEGGNIFWCTAEGKNLRRVATGFWNPFGICRDIFGRIFAVDNDPDSSPPCRLLHIVEGGDYGYQFRYGRAGRHPFQSWFGTLPGALPIVSGTGEAPCEIISYESDGLPKDYLGSLLVAAWADHRIERYVPKAQGSSFIAQRQPFIQGGYNFRPIGIAVAPDGSLFISDWVLPDYTLHGKGAIWHVRRKDAQKVERPTDPQKALFSAHRPLREAAARMLAEKTKGRELLLQVMVDADVRSRASSLTALIDCGMMIWRENSSIPAKDANIGVRAMAVRAFYGPGLTVPYLGKEQPAEVRRDAIRYLDADEKGLAKLIQFLSDDDPFIRHAAVQRLRLYPKLLVNIKTDSHKDALNRIGLLLACRASERKELRKFIPHFLADTDEDVRFLAVKWIADQRLTEHRAAVTTMLKEPKLSVRIFLGCITAIARLDGKEVNDAALADFFIERLLDDQTSPELRVKALQLTPTTHPKLTLDLLAKLLEKDDIGLRVEAIRALAEHPDPKRVAGLREVLTNKKQPTGIHAQAVAGLGASGLDLVKHLFQVDPIESALRDEALRGLVGMKLTAAQHEVLNDWSRRYPSCGPLVQRALGRPFFSDRPKSDDIDAWLKRLEGPADFEAGRRIFFHAKVGSCSRCHRIDGRGQDLGPDLSGVGHNGRRRIVESILQPSVLVPPRYQAWVLELNDGRVLTGMLVRTYLDEYTYLDEKGNQFKVKTGDIAETRPAPASIMPAGLVDALTDQELRDLLAYLQARR